MTYFCLSLVLQDLTGMAPAALEQEYEAHLKDAASFLYRHAHCRAAIHIPGVVLSWLSREHGEFVQLLEKLVSRKQVELTGGGYYAPLFPLLFPQDRTGQLELLTGELRRTVGKRPRGARLYQSVWDPSLVSCLAGCGIEYVFLDGALVPGEGGRRSPLIVSAFGKSVRVLLEDAALSPRADEDARAYIGRIRRECAAGAPAVDAVISVPLGGAEFARRCSSGWLEEFYAAVEADGSGCAAVRPHDAVRAVPPVSAYVAAGMGNAAHGRTVFDFLLSTPGARTLCNRMMYVGLLINQCKGDRMRRNAAREHLWQAQSGGAYLGGSAECVQRAYKALAEAEKLVREATGARESVTSFDYDGDGQNEYVCAMALFNAVVSRGHGRVASLCPLLPGGNYAGERGLFVERLVPQDGLARYAAGTGGSAGGSTAGLFSEVKFEGLRREIHLSARTEFSALNLPVSFRKRYAASSTGLTVQLIIRNEGPLPLRCALCVESDFADPGSGAGYAVEVISGEERQARAVSPGGGMVGASSYVQVLDTANGVSFVYEPNEECGVACAARGGGLCVALCWDVELAPGLEMEKTVNFAVAAAKKRRGKGAAFSG